MDILSYLLGKKAGGGGGTNLQNKNVTITSNGTTVINPDVGYDGLKKVNLTVSVGGVPDLDWTLLGYNSRPQSIDVGYNYALEIKNDWDATVVNLSNKFQYDHQLIFMPMVDTSNATSMASMFRECYGLQKVPILDTANNKTMQNMFYSCYNLLELPFFNTNKVENMNSMCYFCEELTIVPQLDTSSTTDLRSAFSGCLKLTDTSLDNILKMCINVKPTYSRPKTLYSVGINDRNAYPVSRIESLPSYQDFINAGWTVEA